MTPDSAGTAPVPAASFDEPASGATIVPPLPDCPPACPAPPPDVGPPLPPPEPPSDDASGVVWPSPRDTDEVPSGSSS